MVGKRRALNNRCHGGKSGAFVWDGRKGIFLPGGKWTGAHGHKSDGAIERRLGLAGNGRVEYWKLNGWTVVHCRLCSWHISRQEQIWVLDKKIFFWGYCNIASFVHVFFRWNQCPNIWRFWLVAFTNPGKKWDALGVCRGETLTDLVWWEMCSEAWRSHLHM